MADRSGGELCSALGTAAGKNLAAVGGSHSLSETMDFGSVALLGLIGTNSCHFSTPPVVEPLPQPPAAPPDSPLPIPRPERLEIHAVFHALTPWLGEKPPAECACRLLQSLLIICSTAAICSRSESIERASVPSGTDAQQDADTIIPDRYTRCQMFFSPFSTLADVVAPFAAYIYIWCCKAPIASAQGACSSAGRPADRSEWSWTA